MGKGVIYKCNGTTWSKSTVQDTGNDTSTVWDAGLIKHSNGTTWYDNYPMEQNYTQSFNATWSQGWKGDGTRLDNTAWNNNIITGSTTNYMGMFGFSQSAIQSFLGGGTVVSARLLINCYETTLNGAPDVVIGKHNFAAAPSGTWSGANAIYTDSSALHVPNGATGGYWVTLKPSQILYSGTTAISGIALKGLTATSEDMGKFSGVPSYTSKLEITVLK
jgi:hypothetical protein